MEDVGQCPDMEAWLLLPSSSLAQAGSIGASLGHFIGALHRTSAHRPPLAIEFDNRQIQRMRLDFQYSAIRSYAERAGLPDADDLGRRAVALGERLQQPGIVVVMGDLWPRSVIVGDEGLRIIDWEFAHFGRPAQDIGHLAAHLWMHSHRTADAHAATLARTVLRSFLEAYRGALGSMFHSLFGAEGVCESAVHFGSEILTRTTGVFQDGYLYSGFTPDHPTIQEAASVAARHIREPWEVNTFDALGWR
jgi:aminoglycoside phosphotransferase (APT) family kinase protein